MKFLIRESDFSIREKYKNLLHKIWGKTKPEITQDLLSALGFRNTTTEGGKITIFNIQSFLLEFLGVDKAKSLTAELLLKTPHKIEPSLVDRQGYDFKYKISKIIEITDFSAEVNILVDDVEGKVTLIMTGGETMNLQDALSDTEIGWEIQNEIVDVIHEDLERNITWKTGISIQINKVHYETWLKL